MKTIIKIEKASQMIKTISFLIENATWIVPIKGAPNTNDGVCSEYTISGNPINEIKLAQMKRDGIILDYSIEMEPNTNCAFA